MARTTPLSLVMLAFASLLGSCSGNGSDDTLPIVLIGQPDSVFPDGLRLSPGAQLVRDATSSGIVALNAEGEVVPALGESWIVTGDGRSFIFRLRQVNWPDGEPLTAEDARKSLLATIRQLRGTSLGLDLRKVDDIRAMTNRVIEIRLTGPMPEFLQLLAQPELAITRNGESIGPMRLERQGEVAILRPVPPEEMGLPEQAQGQSGKPVRLWAASGKQANEAFSNGDAAALLDGTLFTLPLADTGPLSRGTSRASCRRSEIARHCRWRSTVRVCSPSSASADGSRPRGSCPRGCPKKRAGKACAGPIFRWRTGERRRARG